MNKVKGLLIAAAIAFTATTTACSHPRSYETLCVDPSTQFRVNDYYCTVGNPYYHPGWAYYVPFGFHAPGYGGHITNYTINNYHAPRGATIRHDSIPSNGGVVTKPKSYSPPNNGGTQQKNPTYKAPSNKAPAYKAPSYKKR